MLIALLSDTHDDIPATQTALTLLAPHHPAAYLHAGDLVDPQMLDLFAHLAPAPFHFVFGNNEFDRPALQQRARELHLHCHGDLAQLSLHGKSIALTHGHLPNTLHQLLFSKNFDYIIHGHTHTRRDERHHTTRIINPGALHRARPRSLALLNLATDELQFLDLPSPRPR